MSDASRIDPEILAALANVLSKDAKGVRDCLPPGEYAIDSEITLAIKGKVDVLEDEEYTPTAKIPHKLAMALFIRYAGVTGPLAMDALVKAMTEAMAIEALEGKAKKAALKAIGEVADLDAAEDVVIKGLGELPKATRNGKVNVSADVRVVAAGPVVLVEGAVLETEEKVG
jgi:hypothetical protein